MDKLTGQLKQKFMDYIDSISCDYDSQEIKNCKDILDEKEDSVFSQLDKTLLLRIIDDDELIVLIDELTEKEEEGNAFD